MHKPTQRVIQVMDILCESRQPMRLSEISKQLDVPKSTLLPILQTLVESRYISKDGNDRYYPGIALLGMGAAAESIYTLGDEIKQLLREVVEEFGETCYYGVLEDSMVRYMEKIDSPQPLRMLTATGHRLPAYATGLGKALLLDHTYEQLQNLYPQPLQPLTEHTVSDLKALEAQLIVARQQGYTWEVEESTEHIRCFGVPVRKNGVIAGAISMALPVFRYDPLKQEKIITALQQTAKNISSILTYCKKGE